MKHKHAEMIKLMADGVRIERLYVTSDSYVDACLADFQNPYNTFRISTNQLKENVKKWRWMYTNKHNTGTEGIYLTPLLTEKEIAKWKEAFSSCALGPRQDWTEVECDE